MLLSGLPLTIYYVNQVLTIIILLSGLPFTIYYVNQVLTIIMLLSGLPFTVYYVNQVLTNIMLLTSNALVQHANYFLEGLAPLERVQVAYSLFGKPAYDEIHSVQLSFR